MRILHKIQQKQAAKKLLDIKKNMGHEIAKITKKGDPKKCFDPHIKTTEINDYCKCNFKDDLDLVTECKDRNQFCYLCCDHEIGKFHKEDLECCYNQCDHVSSKKNSCDRFGEIYNLAIPIHSDIHDNLLHHNHHILHHDHILPHHHHHLHHHPIHHDIVHHAHDHILAK